MVLFPMTLSNLQGHSLLQFLQMLFSYSYAAANDILTDFERRAVHLR